MTIHVDQYDASIASSGHSRMSNLVVSRTQDHAVAFLERCVRDLEPLSALTGIAGAGKSVVLNTALARCESDGNRVIRVSNFVAGPLSLHRVLAASLGVSDASTLSAEELEPALRKALSDADTTEPPVLAVDDAQSLLPETLRYLCLLAGLRENGRPLLRILLVGRPGFTVREAMPLQYTLESMRPEDAREAVLRGFGGAGIRASEDTARLIVEEAQGNWRKLAGLIDEGIETAQSAAPKVRNRPMSASGRARPISKRRSRSSSWLVLPGILAIGIVGAAVAYDEGLFEGHLPDQHGEQMQERSLPASDEAVQRPVGAASGSSPNSGVVSAGPPVAAPAAVAMTPTMPPVDGLVAGKSPSTTTVIPAPPTVASSVPLPQAESSDEAAPAPAASGSLAAGAAHGLVVQTPLSPVGANRFVVYNISACHHGICPRWSVFASDQKSRFVASVDLSRLNLDSATIRRLRESAIQMTVSGTVKRGGPDGRILVADQLESVSPRHGRGSEESFDAPQEMPITQSPPPGFLAFPSDQTPTQLAPPPLSSPPN